MGAMGGAAKGLGATLGGVTKVLGGWPGLVLMAVKAMADFILDADQFVKDQNKVFALMRGPDIMTADVEKQFKEFNDQIFKMSENIKVGFNVKQIQEFFNAVNQAGLNITTLNRGLYDYRDAIYIAAKASKTLGMDLPYIGAQMGDLITNFRANLKQVDEAFIQVAFDAGKSGLSTDRFWTAVKNASAGMAMYGLFIKAASKTMKAFTESQVMGAEDAIKATDEMYDVFKKGSLKSKFAVVQFAGGITEAFKDKVAELKTGETEIKGKIKFETDKSSPNVQELMKLNKELAANQATQLRAQAAASGDQLAQVNELTQISDKAPEIITSALERIAGRPLDELKPGKLYTVIQQASEKIGISTDLATKMLNVAIANRKELDGLSNALDKGLDKLNAGQKERLKQIAGIDSDVANALEKGNIPALKKLLKDAKVRKAVEKANFESDTATQTDMADSAEKTFQDINKQTLSYKEMIDIAKDEVKWRAYSLGIFRSLNSGVNDIIGFMRQGKLTETQKIANDQLKNAVMTNKELQGLHLQSVNGTLTAGSQLELTKRVASNLDKLSTGTAVSKRVGGALTVAGKETSPFSQMSVISKSIDGLEEEMKTIDKTGKGKKRADLLQKTITKLKDANKKLGEGKSLKDIANQNDEDLKNAAEQLAEQQQIATSLGSLNDDNKSMLDIQSAMLESDPKAMAVIADKVETSGDQGMETMKKYGVSAEALNQAIIAAKALDQKRVMQMHQK